MYHHFPQSNHFISFPMPQCSGGVLFSACVEMTSLPYMLGNNTGEMWYNLLWNRDGKEVQYNVTWRKKDSSLSRGWACCGRLDVGTHWSFTEGEERILAVICPKNYQPTWKRQLQRYYLLPLPRRNNYVYVFLGTVGWRLVKAKTQTGTSNRIDCEGWQQE